MEGWLFSQASNNLDLIKFSLETQFTLHSFNCLVYSAIHVQYSLCPFKMLSLKLRSSVKNYKYHITDSSSCPWVRKAINY